MSIVHRSLRLTTFGLVTLGVPAFSIPCAAQPTAVMPEPELEVHAVRAFLELQAVFLLGVIYYGSTGNSDSGFSVNYDWDVFRRKISGQSFNSDRNHFATNFIGHPLGGAGYYLSARSNGLGVLASSAVSFAGSFIWELFGEPKEEISMNDTIVTPLAGIAIGETTFGLAHFFNRSAPTWYNRALGVVLGPFTALNQRIDGSRPARMPVGYPTNVWHDFRTSAALLQVHERKDGRFVPVPEIEAQTHVRIDAFPLPTKTTPLHVGTFANGRAVYLGLGAAHTTHELSRVEAEFQSVLTGIHYAAAESSDVAESGYLGLGMGFTYTQRRYKRADSVPLSHWSSTRPLHVATGHHVKRGKLNVDAWAAAGPTFSGVDALALDLPNQSANFPNVVRDHGYYFGWGAFSQALVQLRYDAATLRVSALSESVHSTRAPGEEPVPSMSDAHQFISAGLGYVIPRTTTELQFAASRRFRRSHVLDTRAGHEEVTTGIRIVARTE